VFGGSGFLGRHALRALAKAGYRLRVAVRLPYAASFLSTIGEVGQLHFVAASVRSDKAVAEAVRDAQAVVNLVGPARPWGGEGAKALYVDGAARVAQAAIDAGVTTLVHISTLDASFETRGSRARLRARGEAMVRERFPAATILRCARAFGPDDRFFNRLATQARMFPAIPLAGRGAQRLQPVFAGDVAAAILRAIDDPATARGRTYELAGPDSYTLRELADFVLKETYRSRRVIGLPGALARDDIPRKGALTFADLGIAPQPLSPIVPSYLHRFRPRGQFETIAAFPAPRVRQAAAAPVEDSKEIDSASWTGQPAE
jgi:NADH dehydrogenase